MNIHKKYIHLALAGLYLGTTISIAGAEPVNINITGKVIASPCVVASGSNINVNLGDIPAADFAVAGTTSTPVNFTINLASCPVGTTSVVVTFTGTEDPDFPVRYKNSGTANVAIELIQVSTGYLKGNNTNITQSVLADRTVTYNLRAQAYSKGNVMPGTISGIVQANFTYN